MGLIEWWGIGFHNAQRRDNRRRFSAVQRPKGARLSAGLERADITGLEPHPPLTDEDVALIKQAVERGNVAEARRIIESKGLTWLSSSVRTSQIQQLPRAWTVLCNE
jgi:hypothetical protein